MREIVSQQLDRLGLKSLIGMSLQRWGSDESWKAIREIHMRGSPEALQRARTLSESRNYRKRALGVYIASQLRRREKDVRFGSIEYALDATQKVLFAGLRDTRGEVICAAISGFGHRPHPDALPDLIKFSSHSDNDIRFNVAVALGRYLDAASTDALLQLAKDQCDDVRDWATFGIGSLHDVNNPAVREMLWMNLRDTDKDVRGEALVGLAIRKDERVIPELLKLLETDCHLIEVAAAESMKSPLLRERLVTMETPLANEDDVSPYRYEHLMDAIAALSDE